jgi:hypothetical protein
LFERSAHLAVEAFFLLVREALVDQVSGGRDDPSEDTDQDGPSGLGVAGTARIAGAALDSPARLLLSL